MPHVSRHPTSKLAYASPLSSTLQNFDIGKLSFTRMHARRDRPCSLSLRLFIALLFLRRKRAATTGASYLRDTRRCTRRPKSRIFNGAWREASAGANKFAVSLSSVKMYLRFLSISRIPPPPPPPPPPRARFHIKRQNELSLSCSAGCKRPRPSAIHFLAVSLRSVPR